MRKKICRIKRGLAVMLSVCMVFGVAPIQAGAEGNDSEIAVQANDSAGKTEQQSTEVEECKHEGVEITFNSNGFGNCPKCNATVYQPAVETTDKYDIDDDSTKDTVYEISNAGQLYWFAGLVNGTLDGIEQNTLANAILTANITVNENLLDSLQYDTEGNVSNGSDFITWIPIADCMGDHITQYSGTFDGNNKTVSGLYFNGDSTCIGLFGSSESDGNIKNVGVVDSYFKGNDFVGGVCGRNDGTITNCYNAGNLTAIESSAAIGGICGYNNGGTVTNCYNTGTVTATGSVASVGGVCGCSIAPISNCYNIGTVTATSSSADISGICGYNYGPVKNCYYLADTEDENGGKTTEQFASGEIAYLLSQGCTVGEGEDAVTYSGSIWGQALADENSDWYPKLYTDGSNKVYCYTTSDCYGQKKASYYTNDSDKSGINISDHTYGTPQYVWGTDADGNVICTALKTCTREGCTDAEVDHAITQTVKATGAVTKKPTCTEKGTKTYTATFSKEGFEVQTKNEDIAATGHKLTYVAATEATATKAGNKAYFVCGDCGKYYEDSAGTKEITDKNSVIIPTKGTVTPAPSNPTQGPGETVTPTPSNPTQGPGGTSNPTPTPGGTSNPTPTPGGTSNPTPTPGGTSNPTPSPDGTSTPSTTPSASPSANPTTVPTAAPNTTPVKPNGSKIKDNTGSTYRVTNAKSKTPTVQYMTPKSSAKGTVTIPTTVTIDKVTYKVTSIADNAFKNNKKITKVVIGNNIVSIGKNVFAKCTKLVSVIIGKNVIKIGKDAFAGCKKLKKIVIKTKKLTKKSVAKGAFRSVGKKVVVQVPKSEYKAYKKLLRAKGLSKKVKIKRY